MGKHTKMLISKNDRYGDLTTDHQSKATEAEILTQQVEKWKFEAEKRGSRVEALETEVEELNVRILIAYSGTSLLTEFTSSQRKLQQLTDHLEELKGVESRIADLERALVEKDEEIKVSGFSPLDAKRRLNFHDVR